MKYQEANWAARAIGLGVGLLAIVLIALTVRVLLVPFVASVFLVYLFEPGIELLQRREMERGRAYILILALTTAGIIVLLTFAPSWLKIETVDGSTQTMSERLGSQLNELETWVHVRFPTLNTVEVAKPISLRAAGLAEHLVVQLPSLFTSFAVNLILVPFIAYFMVRDGRKMRRQIAALAPNRYFEMSLIVFHRIDEQIGGYLRGRLIECMLVAVTQILLMGLTSYFVPLPQILLISIVCGVTNLIPYLGPAIGSAFGIFLYLSANLPMNSIWALLIVVAIAHLIDNIVIAPAVLSHNVDLHPLTVALVLLIGGEVLGVLGLLIAIPVASSIKVIVQEFYANYRVQVR